MAEILSLNREDNPLKEEEVLLDNHHLKIEVSLLVVAEVSVGLALDLQIYKGICSPANNSHL